MARKRMIDPSIWTDEGMGALTTRQQLLFIGLFSNADDAGRLRGSTTAIRLMLPTLYVGESDAEIRDDIAAVLAQIRAMVAYEVDGREYLAFANYERWQRIEHPSKSTLPDPFGEGSVRLRGAFAPSLISVVSSVEVSSEQIDTAADAAALAPDADSEVDYSRDVFDEYQVRIQPKARFLDDARRKIRTRLRRWSLQELRAAIEHFAADAWQMEHNAHRGAGWFFANDSRIEQYVNLKPRKAAGGDPDKFARFRDLDYTFADQVGAVVS